MLANFFAFHFVPLYNALGLNSSQRVPVCSCTDAAAAAFVVLRGCLFDANMNLFVQYQLNGWKATPNFQMWKIAVLC